jgi:hypothetical protein
MKKKKEWAFKISFLFKHVNNISKGAENAPLTKASLLVQKEEAHL